MSFISLGVRLTETVNNYYGLKSTFIIERNSRSSEKKIKEILYLSSPGTAEFDP